jgi:hypothetical protein
MRQATAASRPAAQLGINLFDGGCIICRSFLDGVQDAGFAIRITHANVHGVTSNEKKYTTIENEFHCRFGNRKAAGG